MSLWFIASFAGAQTAPKPLTLDESVAMALRESPQARAAWFAKEAAQVQADREKPGARPTLNATAAGTMQGPRVTFPRPNGPDAVVLPEQAGRLDIILEQVLYRPGLGAAKQRYAAQSSVVELDYRRELADLALSARKAYLDVLKAASGVRVAQDGLDAARRYQALVQKQIEAGQAKPVDAETVKAQVAEAQAGVTQAEGGLKLAQYAFNKTLGRPLATPVLLTPLGALPTVPDSPDAAIMASRNRPEIVSLEQNVKAALAGVSLAKTQSQPTLSARGQLTEQTPTGFAHEHYAAATLEIRWPLLDGGKARLDTKEAKAQAERLAALLDDTREAIALQVTQAWQKMREAAERRTLALTQIEGAQATATVAEKAYEVGRGTVVEVQAAQREVRNARERELQATYDLQAAEADFLYAQGAILPAKLPAPVKAASGKKAEGKNAEESAAVRSAP